MNAKIIRSYIYPYSGAIEHIEQKFCYISFLYSNHFPYKKRR